MRSRFPDLATLRRPRGHRLVIAVAVAGRRAVRSSPRHLRAGPARQDAQAGDVTAVSGDVAWQNELFGDSRRRRMAQLPAQSPLTSSGSGASGLSNAGAEGRVAGRRRRPRWSVVNKAARTADLRLRAEHGQEGRVFDRDRRRRRLRLRRRHRGAHAGDDHPVPAAGARFATVEVAGQTTVAGRDAVPAAHGARRHRHRPSVRRRRPWTRDHAAAAASTV